MTGTPSTIPACPSPGTPDPPSVCRFARPNESHKWIAHSVATCICLLSTEWHVFYSFLSLTFSFGENVKFRGRSQASHTGLPGRFRLYPSASE